MKKTIGYGLVLVSVFALLLFPAGGLTQSASDLRNQIGDLNQRIDDNQSNLREMQRRAETLEERLAQLRLEITTLNDQIERTRLEIERTEAELEETRSQLAHQREILAANVVEIYKTGEPSTLELLAASENFSDFINRQEYLRSVKAKVQAAANALVELEADLEQQEAELNSHLSQQSAQRTVLADRQGEQQRLLDETRGQEARFQQLLESDRRALEEANRLLEQITSCVAGGGNWTGSRCERPQSGGPIVSHGWVESGQQVGHVGSTGFSTGPHLHFEVRTSNGGTINPQAPGGGLVNGYLWPVGGSGGWVSQPYGCVAPPHWYATKCAGGTRSFHTGLDIAAQHGTPVLAAAAGDIIFRGWIGGPSTGYGYTVMVRHSDGFTTVYPHMVPQ